MRRYRYVVKYSYEFILKYLMTPLHKRPILDVQEAKWTADHFLKFLGISAATAVVAPKVLASEPPQSYDDMMEQVVITMDKMLKEDQYKERIAQENLRAVEQFLLEDKEIPEQLRVKWLKALLKVKRNV